MPQLPLTRRQPLQRMQTRSRWLTLRLLRHSRVPQQRPRFLLAPRFTSQPVPSAQPLPVQQAVVSGSAAQPFTTLASPPFQSMRGSSFLPCLQRTRPVFLGRRSSLLKRHRTSFAGTTSIACGACPQVVRVVCVSPSRTACPHFNGGMKPALCR